MPYYFGEYTYKCSGTNKEGNHYCARDYGSSAVNSNCYHYSNQDGSYYYSNPDGSTYYNDGKGGSVYTPPSSGSVNSGGGNEDSYPSRDATDSTSCNDYKSNLDGTTYDNNEEGESMYTPSSSGSMNPTGGSEGQQHSSNSNYTTTSVSCPSASVYGFGGEIRK